MFDAKIRIDKELLGKVKKYAAIAGYSSPEEFVHHVLEREIQRLEGDSGGDTEEEIRKRMQGLGYIS
jgi:hypothetical protein